MILQAPQSIVKIPSSLNAQQMEQARTQVIGIPVSVDDSKERKEVLSIVNTNEVGKPDKRIFNKYKQHTKRL